MGLINRIVGQRLERWGVLSQEPFDTSRMMPISARLSPSMSSKGCPTQTPKRNTTNTASCSTMPIVVEQVCGTNTVAPPNLEKNQAKPCLKAAKVFNWPSLHATPALGSHALSMNCPSRFLNFHFLVPCHYRVA